MPKIKSHFSCQSCGYQSTKWMGRCPECGEWNTFVEEREDAEDKTRWSAEKSGAVKPIPISEIESCYEKKLISGIAEFDRVLGGGIVPGSLILIGGDPGIGKSTLLLQASAKVSKDSGLVLYISGEESGSQIRLRSDRLGSSSDRLLILSETCLEDIIPHIEKVNPSLIVVDSIQTIYTTQLQSAPGSISQVREVSFQLMQISKKIGIATFLIGHVTKDGAIAGPRVLEHMVDTVLYFEGDRGHTFRVLRAIKNRFGSVNEIGVFEMKNNGLEEVTNPSELFLSEMPNNISGSVVVSSIEGTRPILVELQALVSYSNLNMPRRMVTGVDPNRVSLLIAILEKRVGLHLQGEDIFVNVAGGVRIDEPAVDLGIVSAIASSFKDKPVDAKTVVVGEVGLAGEVRGVTHIDKRLTEASKLGFTRCIIPKVKKDILRDIKIEIIEVSSVGEALEVLL
ncbi:MAG: DNA repair protein RadA [Nitrospinae bacterium]|nr:DNA repair protein RadA [Nitrospinota bacterium]